MLVELGVVEQRYRAVLEVLDEGVPVTVVAQRYGVARQTVHEWLRRYAGEGGLGGLADRSSRPGWCPHQMPAVVEARVVAVRREHPGWGPSRICLAARTRGHRAAAGAVQRLPGAGAPRAGGGEEAQARREDYRRWDCRITGTLAAIAGRITVLGARGPAACHLPLGAGHASHVGQVTGDQRQTARRNERDRARCSGHRNREDQRPFMTS